MSSGTGFFSAAEYSDMVLIYGECNYNGAQAIRLYRERYSATRRCPGNLNVITSAIQRMRDNLPLVPTGPQGTSNSKIRNSLKEKVLEHFTRNPTCSLRKAAGLFGVHPSSIQNILNDDERQPYKLPSTPAPPPKPRPIREKYCRWLLQQMRDDSEFMFNVMWTGLSTFAPSNGMCDDHNRYYWGKNGPSLDVSEGSSQHPCISLNVWAAIHRDTIIGPVFIEGRRTADKFLEVLTGPVSEYVEELPLDIHGKLWYQLDGAPQHCVPTTRKHLTKMFGEQWIGRHGPRRWPAQSADLTPVHTFLFPYVKNEVYARDVSNVEELREKIKKAFNKLRSRPKISGILSKERKRIEKRCDRYIKDRQQQDNNDLTEL